MPPGTSRSVDVDGGGTVMRIGTCSAGAGKFFRGRGVGGKSKDGLGESCSFCEMSNSRESSWRRCWWSMWRIARHRPSNAEPVARNVRARRLSSGILCAQYPLVCHDKNRRIGVRT